MKRVEFQQLKPGDIFEYQAYNQRALGGRDPMRRDTVKPWPDGTWRKDQPAYVFWKTNPFFNPEDADSFGQPQHTQHLRFVIELYTEHGSTGHGYVKLYNDDVVVLIEEGDK